MPSPMEAFVGNNVKFSIDYPSSWVARELPQGSHGDLEVFAIIINPGNSFPSVYFARQDFKDENMDQVVEWGEHRILALRQISEYEPISLANILTANFDGFIRQYSWKSESFIGKTTIRCEDYYILENKVGYDLSFCSYEKDWEKTEGFFQQMMESFDLR